MKDVSHFPFLGFGLGLRAAYYDDFLSANEPLCDWLEVITEDVISRSGFDYEVLERLREQYPVVLHGVGLSLGSCDPLSRSYLDQLKALQELVDPAWISDHLCFSGVDGYVLHDLLPLPYTEECLDHVSRRIDAVQDHLQRPLVVENVSAYVFYRSSEMTEATFLRKLTERTGCGLLLDINNVYVTACNEGFSPAAYLAELPLASVVQCHLAGHQRYTDLIVDTHDHPVCEDVWRWYEAVCAQFPGPVSTLLERDDAFPPLEELCEELHHAERLAEKVWEAESV